MISISRFVFACAILVPPIAACSTKPTGSALPSGPAGGLVIGAQDSHCTADGGAITQSVVPGACHADAGPPPMPDDAGIVPSPYGDTMFNAEGDDDDCKYHVKWASSGVYKNYDINFNVTLTNEITKAPEKGASIRAEVFLNDRHPAPNSNQMVKETADGVYTVGPIQLDASGQWTVRFHFHDECNDLPEAAHGHAAFFVQVP
jgi:hypothetical protein